MCGRFLPSKEHDPHRLWITCRGKSCISDDRCEECYDWPDKLCTRVADYVEKLSLQRERKKERKTKSSSLSSFSSFSPSMPVPLDQLPSPVGSGVVTSFASSSAVCVVTYAVACPAVTTAPFVPPPSVTPIEPSRTRRHVTDPKKWELMMLEFEDLWASGKSTSRSCPFSASQQQLITPPVMVPAPVPSAVAAPSAAALSGLYRPLLFPSQTSGPASIGHSDPVQLPLS